MGSRGRPAAQCAGTARRLLLPPIPCCRLPTQAAALGMQTRVLSVEWPGGQVPATGNKQQAARDARYALLLRACGELGRSHLLLGHHAGDQAETFLLRLKHASGVAGLACMPRVAVKHTGAPPPPPPPLLGQGRSLGRGHWLPCCLHSSGAPRLCLPARPAEFGSVRLLRPLLGFTKAELEGYCQRGGLEYVRDPTNAQLAYHRCTRSCCAACSCCSSC